MFVQCTINLSSICNAKISIDEVKIVVLKIVSVTLKYFSTYIRISNSSAFAEISSYHPYSNLTILLLLLWMQRLLAWLLPLNAESSNQNPKESHVCLPCYSILLVWSMPDTTRSRATEVVHLIFYYVLWYVNMYVKLRNCWVCAWGAKKLHPFGTRVVSTLFYCQIIMLS